MRTLLSVLTLTLFLFIFSCNNEKSTSNLGAVQHDTTVARGEYLMSTLGCADCHSPKKMGEHGPEIDMELYLSGHPSSTPLAKIDTAVLHNWVLFTMDQTVAVGPWGITYAANITPDSTGIGGWSKTQFFKALREGKHKGLDNSRPILPPMPWQYYKNFNDDDLTALYNYLKSIKPVHNIVPEPVAPNAMITAAK